MAEKNDKNEKQEKTELREKNEAMEKHQLMAKRSAVMEEECEDEDTKAKKAKEERERWQKPPEPIYSKENLALLKEFAKKAAEVRKLVNDPKYGMSLPIGSRFVGALAGVANISKELNAQSGAQGEPPDKPEQEEAIPRDGHIAHSTDPPMSLAYAPPGVNPEPWVPAEPLDRLGLGPDARLLTPETVAPAGTGVDPRVPLVPPSKPDIDKAVDERGALRK